MLCPVTADQPPSLQDRISNSLVAGRAAPEELPRHLRLIHPGGLKPTEAESAANPPSRSARLRVGERLALR